MKGVWISFLIAAFLLALGAAAASRALALRKVAWLLAAMSLGTAAFPALLGTLGVAAFVAGYVLFVVALTVSMTLVAIRGALSPR